jgi:Sigma 54 modulation protein / S30EA ribosomal protein
MMMRCLRSLPVLVLLLSPQQAVAFLPTASHRRSTCSSSNNRQQQQQLSPLYSSSSTSATNNVPIILNGVNIELTPALEDYVNKRIGNTLSKLASNGAVRECDVLLSVNKNPRVRFSLLLLLFCALETLCVCAIHCLAHLGCILDLIQPTFNSLSLSSRCLFPCCAM